MNYIAVQVPVKPGKLHQCESGMHHVSDSAAQGQRLPRLACLQEGMVDLRDVGWKQLLKDSVLREQDLTVLDELISGFSCPANIQGWEPSPQWGASPLLHSHLADSKKEQVGMSVTLHVAPSGTALGHGDMANAVNVKTGKP